MDNNTMDTKKKDYTAPELVEHGNLTEVTQDGCRTGAGDTVDYSDFTTYTGCI
ncbi:MAG: lasso RiPP family leader peptide-containing protein [Chloroflexota bacterium]